MYIPFGGIQRQYIKIYLRSEDCNSLGRIIVTSRGYLSELCRRAPRSCNWASDRCDFFRFRTPYSTLAKNFLLPSSLKLIELLIIILAYFTNAENSIFIWPSVVHCLPVSPFVCLKVFTSLQFNHKISFGRGYLNGCDEKKMHWQHWSHSYYPFTRRGD